MREATVIKMKSLKKSNKKHQSQKKQQNEATRQMEHKIKFRFSSTIASKFISTKGEEESKTTRSLEQFQRASRKTQQRICVQ